MGQGRAKFPLGAPRARLGDNPHRFEDLLVDEGGSRTLSCDEHPARQSADPNPGHVLCLGTSMGPPAAPSHPKSWWSPVDHFVWTSGGALAPLSEYGAVVSASYVSNTCSDLIQTRGARMLSLLPISAAQACVDVNAHDSSDGQ